MVTRIYLSGPITKGNRTHNFYQACQAHKLLMAAGYSVLNPMLTMLHPDEPNIPHGQWLASDLPWVEVSDCVIRLPGESVGADMETAHARDMGVPVFGPEVFPCLHSLFPPAVATDAA